MSERVSFLIAIKQGQAQTIIDAVDKLKLVPANGPRQPELQYEVNDNLTLRIYFKEIVSGISLPNKTGTWTVYYCLPAPMMENNKLMLDWKTGTIFFRKIARAAANHPNILIGPWSPKQVKIKYPAFASQYVPDGVGLTIAGVSAEYLANIDYNPSQEDIDNDVEIDHDVLFPPPQP